MTEFGSNIDAALLDRLVDGEMDPRAQAALLARLDERPGDWRRLALAFVESQTLGVELRGALRDAKQSPDRAPNPVEKPAAINDSAAPWTKLLSLAATMLVAVGIGFGAGRVWNRPQSNPGNAMQPAGKSGTVKPGDALDATLVDNDVLVPQGTMTMQSTDGSTVELPVYAASYGAERMLAADESSVPPEVVRALRSRGHEVSQQRRYWPIDLGDGRQIIVPIDQVDVQYVGDRAYQ